MKTTPIELEREGRHRTVAIVDDDEIEIRSQYEDPTEPSGWYSDPEDGITISKAALDRLIDVVHPNPNAEPEPKP